MLPGVLIVEDETRLAKSIKSYLEEHGFDVHISDNAEAGLAEFGRFKPDIVLLDFKLPDNDGLQVLEQLRALDSQLKVIMMSGAGGIEVAVQAMKLGACDYLVKPLVLKELKLLIERISGQERLEGALRYYKGREAATSGVDKLLGESPETQALKDTIRRLLETDYRFADSTPPTVLIRGATGTGKELVARALHFDGPRRDQEFIELNCAAIPTDLVESELFGYERGAFTNARVRKLGLVEAAHQGTLFLDEAGELAPVVQTKVLKLLDDKVVRRLGGLRDMKVDVRIIAATNQPLEELVAEGRFRADLYYRLRVVELELPTLRERGRDILLLANHFLAHLCKRYGRADLRLNHEAEQAMLHHQWPGNVRELRNLIEQTVLLAQGPEIRDEDLRLPQYDAERDASHSQVATDIGDGREDVTARESSLSIDAPAAGVQEFTLPDAGIDLKELEAALIVQALKKSGGNITRAAALLGLSRDTLRYRMEKYGIASPSRTT